MTRTALAIAACIDLFVETKGRCCTLALDKILKVERQKNEIFRIVLRKLGAKFIKDPEK